MLSPETRLYSVFDERIKNKKKKKKLEKNAIAALSRLIRVDNYNFDKLLTNTK